MSEILLQSWLLIALFIANLIFFLIMSFVSPYYKSAVSRDWLHIILICIIIIIVGIFMFLKVSCAMRGQGIYCRLYAWCTILIILAITAWTIIFHIYKDHQYRTAKKQNNKPIVVSELFRNG
jgi:FlaA1/EpsC-like NDP-sugar epimerase